MSARQEISVIKKLGIIAGGGVLPLQLKAQCDARGIETAIVGFTKYTDHVHPNFWARIGTSGKTIQWLKSQGVTDLVMIGNIKRPNLWDLWPDWVTLKFFITCWVRSFGDSNMLSAARSELEGMGFKIHGVHKFLPSLLMPEGMIGFYAPKDAQQKDIQLGIKAARDLGAQDIGQAVIMKDGQVIAREDKYGTSTLIKNYGCAGAILVKMCKPQQDMDLDLPTIGPITAQLCAAKKMTGIVGQAGKTLLVEREAVQKIADENNIFMMGITIDG